MKLNLKPTVRINALSLSKFAFLVFALYIFWFRYAYGMNQIIFYGSAILVALFVGLDILVRGQLSLAKMPKIVKAYFVLAFYAFVSGVFVAQNKSSVISAVISFTAYTVICFSAAYISDIEGSFDWASKILVICGVVVAAYIYFRGYSYETSGVTAITLGEEHNPNYLGGSILAVIFALLYDFERFQKRIIFHSLLLLLFIGVVIFSASRTSFIGLVLLLVGWVVRYAVAIRKKELSKISPESGQFKKDFLAASILLIGVGVGIFFLFNEFDGTAVYEKFVRSLNEGEGFASRRLLYREAWQIFLKHPLFGVGLDQFREYSSNGMYSHAVYAEIPSCLGIFGCLIFFFPLFSTYFQMMGTFFHRKLYSSTDFMLLLMLTVELVIGIGHIHLYAFHSLLVLTMIFWILEHKNQNTPPLTDEQEGISNV